MKILKLSVSNIMRISAVEIEPTGHVVVIGGNNGQGKSSVLSAIEMALGGKDHVVEKPIREGEERGKIVVNLGEIEVERIFTANGTRLVVRASNGAVFPSPQAMLDKLIGKLTFDPLAFSRAKEKDQSNILRQLAGLDTSDIDLKRGNVFDHRTELNREAERLKAQLTGIEIPTSDMEIPESEPNVSELLKELEALQTRNAERKLTEVALASAQKNALNAEIKVLTATETVENLVNALKNAHIELEDQTKHLDSYNKALDLATYQNAKAEEEIEDETLLKKKISQSQEVGRIVRLLKTKQAVEADLNTKVEEAKRLTGLIETLDEEKQTRIAAASFPVPGLAVGDDTVLLNGIPFQQASSAEQLRASIAIGVALNPKLKVMIVRDGSLLDEGGLKLITEFSEANDYQLWIERCGKDESMHFIIEDGTVLEAKVGPAVPANQTSEKEATSA